MFQARQRGILPFMAGAYGDGERQDNAGNAGVNP